MYLKGRLTAKSSQFLTTLLIFSLSAGVLGGILIYLDSAGPLILNEMSEDLYIDMKVELSNDFHLQDELTLTDIIEFIYNQNGVSSVEPIITIESSTSNDAQKILRTYSYLGIPENFLNEFSNVIQLSDNCYPLVNTGCYVEEGEFQRLGLEINGTYPVPIVTGHYFYDIVTKNFTVQGTFSSLGLWGNLDSPGAEYSILKMVTTIEAMESQFGYLGFGDENALNEEIWVKYGSNYIIESDSSKLQSELELDRQRIDQQIVPYAIVSEFNLLNVVYGYSSWQTSIRSISIFFSIPTLTMAIMLIQYSSNLVRDDQRRESGSLRIRGASGWQVFKWIMSMALFTGFIGSLGAILAGQLAAILSGSTSGLMTFDFSILQHFEIIINPMTVLAIFLFSFVAGTLITLPSAIQMIIMEINDTHKMIEQETTNHEGMINSTVEVAIIVVSGLLCYVLLDATNSLMSSNLLLSLLFISVFGAFVTSLAHLLSRPSSNIKSWVLHRLKKPVSVSVARPVGRTAVMKKRSETIGIMFVSMVFVAGIFSSLSAYTGSMHSRDLILFNTGADILIETNPTFHNITLDIIPEIKEIEGVIEASGVFLTYEHVLYQAIGPYSTLDINRTMLIIGVQPETWKETAFWRPYFTSEMTPESALAILSENNHTALSSFKPINGFELVGDSYEPLYGNFLSLQIGSSSKSKFVDLSIIDVLAENLDDDSLKYLPGMPSVDEFLVVNIDILHEFYNSTELDLLYLSIEDGANCTHIENEINSISQNGFSSVNCAQERIDALERSSMSRSIVGVYTLNILFSILYLTLGMAIVAVEKNRHMRSDLSLLRAFGLEPSRILLILLIDSALGIGYAAMIGGSIGFVLSFLILNSPLVYIGVSDVTSWSRLPVVLTVPWSLLTSIVILSFILPIIAVLVVNAYSLKTEVAAGLLFDEG